MKVFVAGGTGAIGSRLVPQLVGAGHEVVATTHSRRRIDELRGLGAEPAVVDGLDEEAVIRAVRDARPEVVIHEMTALSGKPDLRRFDRYFATTNELRTRGTDYLIRGAQVAGARRLIAQSYTGSTNIRAGGPVKDEDDPLDPHPPKAMREMVAGVRHLEQAVTGADGLEGVALRYGALYGPSAGTAEQLGELLRKRRMPLVGEGGGVWSWLQVDDAAAATVAAIDRGEGIYNVVDDDPAPAAEWLPYFAEVLGAKPPLRLPVWLARLVAGEVVVSMMTQIRGSSNAKAKRELGWQPRYPSWREGFRDGLEDAPAPLRAASSKRAA